MFTPCTSKSHLICPLFFYCRYYCDRYNRKYYRLSSIIQQ